jgi:hypothetical protein
MRRANAFAMTSAVIAVTTLVTASADARCTTLAFSVNDYGKEGPSRDAQTLLDKYIASWTKSKGIKSYTVGKKDVTCELFLNLVVVDEHTCKASAKVCWADAGKEHAAK